MPFEPVSQQSAPEIVFDQIVEGVLSGDLPAGEALPSERELTRILGVSRPTVREALKRVAAAGLVSIRQGDGARVQDIARTGGLDLLPRLLIRGGALVPSVARSIVEARAAIGPGVAGLAANDPKHSWSLRSAHELAPGLQLDLSLRHVGGLPEPAVPGYHELDARIAWQARPNLELALVGRNLLHDEHAEFGVPGVRQTVGRSLTASAILQF
mgnify:CR=1 FL=1